MAQINSTSAPTTPVIISAPATEAEVKDTAAPVANNGPQMNSGAGFDALAAQPALAGFDAATISRIASASAAASANGVQPQIIVIQNTVAPAAQPEAAPVAEAKPVAKKGFFAKIGSAIAAPFRAISHMGENMGNFGRKALGLTTTVGVGGTSLAAGGVFAANHFAPVAVHNALGSLGLGGLLGPQSGALVAGGIFGVAALAAIAIGVTILRSGPATPPAE
ncbi:hypothetical protein KAI87_04775 [Myxococcota bacterium]|nr:hypothetical protein [Myxococcota bacterium]